MKQLVGIFFKNCTGFVKFRCHLILLNAYVSLGLTNRNALLQSPSTAPHPTRSDTPRSPFHLCAQSSSYLFRPNPGSYFYWTSHWARFLFASSCLIVDFDFFQPRLVVTASVKTWNMGWESERGSILLVLHSNLRVNITNSARNCCFQSHGLLAAWWYLALISVS